jgi:DNA repair protein RAD7
LVDHSGETLEKLSILGWKDVSADTVSELARCTALKELDLGWCRNVTDFTIKDVLDGCDQIRLLRVWGELSLGPCDSFAEALGLGCNQLTDAVPRKKGVNIIGIETHSI